ncbi:aldose epimerase family protein [Actinacidiphila rubida]|uniref:Aldose 1-epimerase n=1 Tax=Actinacidiphila rubida TaxID=310780 RepID=A0A1H8KF04_9ACTN|nr:aldose epimerase family protein [Actinacidiphila rubida]SEN91028.1 aldose 1-epimerase [Actinacidiphila rubida]
MANVSRSVAGTLPDGRTIHRWRIATSGGTSADILTLGASLHALRCADRAGRLADVVVSPQRLADKLSAARYAGATVGRYANRIAGGRLPTREGARQLGVNEGGNTLHGGLEGFDTRVWSARPVGGGARAGVECHLASPDGDQGFPGTLTATVTYTLSEEGELRIEYVARTDAPTPVNLTNHAYWNLSGGDDDTVLDHELWVGADHFMPIDASLLPLPGPASSVRGSPFDLAEPRRLRDAVGAVDEQLRLAGGFDHNWVLRPGTSAEPRLAAVLSHGPTGRRVQCLTTEPGLQVYTGNHFAGEFLDESGLPVGRHAAVALETQHFPDSPRRPDYPSTWLAPGDVHRSTTVYRIGVVS